MYHYNEELIQKKIFEVMKVLSLSRMPTSKEVRLSKVQGLDPAISRTGGYKLWAEKLNLSPKAPEYKHSEKDISNGILRVINHLKLDRMPSRSEVLKSQGNHILHNAIVRSFGYYGWAEKLNLSIKDSETKLGISYQDYCLNQLKKMGYNVQDTSILAPYDLLLNNNVRIDVKCGCAYDMRGSRVHSFGINKKFPSCDIYIIYALDETSEFIERTFIIPSKDLKVISLCIGLKSKYNKYINRWDYLDLFDTFYKSIAN